MNIKKLLPFFVALLALVTCVGISTTTAAAKTRSVPNALRGKWFMEGNEAQLAEQITLTAKTFRWASIKNEPHTNLATWQYFTNTGTNNRQLKLTTKIKNNQTFTLKRYKKIKGAWTFKFKVSHHTRKITLYRGKFRKQVLLKRHPFYMNTSFRPMTKSLIKEEVRLFNL